MTSSRVPIAEGQRMDVDRAGRRRLVHTAELGPHCRCRGCGIKRSGRRADGRRWTPEQDEALAALYGTMAVAAVAAELNRRFHTRRSETGTYNRAADLGLSATAKSWAAYALAVTLGVAPGTVYGWCDEGLLASFSTRRAGRSMPMRRILKSEAERFVAEHWRRFDTDGISDRRLRAVHEVASRRVKVLSTGDVARRLKTTPDRVRKPIEEGRVPGVWKATGIRGGGRAWGWRIPESAVDLIARLLAEDAARYRAERAERWQTVQALGNAILLARRSAAS